jgi:uncharacterized membrane protein
MDDMQLIIATLSRIVHVGTAIVLVGGTVFLRLVVMPAAEKLAPEAHDTFRASLVTVWKRFVHTGIVLFLITGLYNYIAVTMPSHRGDKLYHMLIGIKILLALIVFFLASVLVGRAAAFEKMRQNRKTWLGVVILLAAIIVAISGFVKVKPPAPASEGEASLGAREHLVDGVPQLVHAKRLS